MLSCKTTASPTVCVWNLIICTQKGISSVFLCKHYRPDKCTYIQIPKLHAIIILLILSKVFMYSLTNRKKGVRNQSVMKVKKKMKIWVVSVNHMIHNLFMIGTSSDKSSLTFLPWLPLSASDRHILSVTASRLQSRSSSLVSKSCEFLRDVLFKDFPAEIFLHRPSVLQVRI